MKKEICRGLNRTLYFMADGITGKCGVTCNARNQDPSAGFSIVSFVEHHVDLWRFSCCLTRAL